ncbi:MAG TPA: ribosome small subunit-dependent GTPase A [Bacillota bacterium]|nr:ribosome small subunit-dependent GTPase A [Bacillota bacterium]
MMRGTIIKGVGSFYDVLTKDDTIRCRARGRLRTTGIVPAVGDNVLIKPGSDVHEGSIEEILPRRNYMKRPAVANVDNLIVVMAAAEPMPDLLLVDKLLVYAEYMDIAPLIAINKIDLVEDDELDKLKKEYLHTEYPSYCISVKEELGIEKLMKDLRGISALAGQSGVGKSSIINALSSDHNLETGEISKKLNRGKHTTRHVELLTIGDGGMIVDTPGFSQLNLSQIMTEELSENYPEFRRHKNKCRFISCLHDQEPECAIREAVDAGLISKGRYQRYLRLLSDLSKQRWY